MTRLDELLERMTEVGQWPQISASEAHEVVDGVRNLTRKYKEARIICRDAYESLNRLPSVDGAYRVTVLKELQDLLIRDAQEHGEAECSLCAGNLKCESVFWMVRGEAVCHTCAMNDQLGYGDGVVHDSATGQIVTKPGVNHE